MASSWFHVSLLLQIKSSLFDFDSDDKPQLNQFLALLFKIRLLYTEYANMKVLTLNDSLA